MTALLVFMCVLGLGSLTVVMWSYGGADSAFRRDRRTCDWDLAARRGATLAHVARAASMRARIFGRPDIAAHSTRRLGNLCASIVEVRARVSRHRGVLPK